LTAQGIPPAIAKTRETMGVLIRIRISRVVIEGQFVHRSLSLSAAELVILSRKRIDNDRPKSACQSANFQMNQ
jgi:hypothetical protein